MYSLEISIFYKHKNRTWAYYFGAFCLLPETVLFMDLGWHQIAPPISAQVLGLKEHVTILNSVLYIQQYIQQVKSHIFVSDNSVYIYKGGRDSTALNIAVCLPCTKP